MKTLIRFFFIIMILSCHNNLSAQQTGLGFGNGKDGSITLSSFNTINTDDARAKVTGFSGYNSSGGLINGYIEVSCTLATPAFSSLSAGTPCVLPCPPPPDCDKVIIIQMEGGNATGKFILAKVQSVFSSGGTYTIGIYDWRQTPASDPSSLFDAVNGFVQIIRIPQYINLTIQDDAVLSCNSYSYTSGTPGGGICFFMVNGTLTITDRGKIDVSGKGYKPGECLNNYGTGGTGGNGGSHDNTQAQGGYGYNNNGGPYVGYDANNAVGTSYEGICVQGPTAFIGANGGKGEDAIEGSNGSQGTGKLTGLSSSLLNYILTMGSYGSGGNGCKGGGAGGNGGGGGGGYYNGTQGDFGSDGAPGGNGGNGGIGGGALYIRASQIIDNTISDYSVLAFGLDGDNGGNGPDATTFNNYGKGGNGGPGGDGEIYNTSYYYSHGGGGSAGIRGDGANGGNGGNGGDGGNVWIIHNMLIPPNPSVNLNGGLYGIGGSGGGYYPYPANAGHFTYENPINYPTNKFCDINVYDINKCDCDMAFQALQTLNNPLVNYDAVEHTYTFTDNVDPLTHCIYYADVTSGGQLSCDKYNYTVQGNGSKPDKYHYDHYYCILFSHSTPNKWDDESDYHFGKDNHSGVVTHGPIWESLYGNGTSSSTWTTNGPDGGWVVTFDQAAPIKQSLYNWDDGFNFYSDGVTYPIHEGKIVSNTGEYAYGFCLAGYNTAGPDGPPEGGIPGSKGLSGQSSGQPEIISDPTSCWRLSFDSLLATNETFDKYFKIVPNPANGSFKLEFIEIEQADYYYTITSSLGAVMQTGKFTSVKGLNYISFDIHSLKVGQYIVGIVYQDKNIYLKLTIK